MRYAIESDSPDGGLSTYAECWGSGGCRGRVLGETSDLAEAIEIMEEFGGPSNTIWIWDRRIGRRPSDRRITALRRAKAEGG